MRAVAVLIILRIAVLVAVLIAVLATVLAAVLATVLAAVLATVLATVLAAVLVPILARLILLARFLFGGHFAVRLGQKAGVMFGVLQKVFCGNAVIAQLGIAGQKLILFDQLRRGAAHLAFGARAVEDAVDDVAEAARAVRFRTRTGLGRAHLVL